MPCNSPTRLWRRLLRSLGVSMGGLVMVGDGINDVARAVNGGWSVQMSMAIFGT